MTVYIMITLYCVYPARSPFYCFTDLAKGIMGLRKNNDFTVASEQDRLYLRTQDMKYHDILHIIGHQNMPRSKIYGSIIKPELYLNILSLTAY